MFDKAFKKGLDIIHKQAIISEELEAYIKTFDDGELLEFGEQPTSNTGGCIYEMENIRQSQIRTFIIGTVQEFAGSSVGKKTRGANGYLVHQNLTSLQIELIINSGVIVILKGILARARADQEAAYRQKAKSAGRLLGYWRGVNRSCLIYANCIESLIEKREKFMADIIEKGKATMNFCNDSLITYGRSIKLGPWELAKPKLEAKVQD